MDRSVHESSKESNNAAENIKVIVRCRPLNQKELAEGYKSCVSLDVADNTVQVNHVCGEPDRWTFDGVVTNTFSQRDIFNNHIRPLANSVLEGYNATVFAYGQSGSGKTHTMTGTLGDPEQQGLIPWTFQYIFDQMRELTTRNPRTHFSCFCSFVELYNGKVRDLLAEVKKGSTPTPLNVKESKDKTFHVQGAMIPQVKFVEELFQHMEEGNFRRQTGATELNADSSRSHSIFSIIIECITQGDDDSSGDAGGKGSNRDSRTVTSKLNLVDLAGSERQSKTGAVGDTLKEGCNINLSLSALGTVIDTLVKGKGHVPFRSSPLTMLLKDSLGGSSKTCMFANIGPSEHNLSETVSTLRFADRAKQIKNKPKVNMDAKDQKITELMNLVKQLREKLKQYECAGDGQHTAADNEEELQTKVEELQVELQAVKNGREQELKQLHQERQKLEIDLITAKETGLESQNQLAKIRSELQTLVTRQQQQEAAWDQLWSSCTAMFGTEVIEDDARTDAQDGVSSQGQNNEPEGNGDSNVGTPTEHHASDEPIQRDGNTSEDTFKQASAWSVKRLVGKITGLQRELDDAEAKVETMLKEVHETTTELRTECANTKGRLAQAQLDLEHRCEEVETLKEKLERKHKFSMLVPMPSSARPLTSSVKNSVPIPLVNGCPHTLELEQTSKNSITDEQDSSPVLKSETKDRPETLGSENAVQGIDTTLAEPADSSTICAGDVSSAQSHKMREIGGGFQLDMMEHRDEQAKFLHKEIRKIQKILSATGANSEHTVVSGGELHDAVAQESDSRVASAPGLSEDDRLQVMQLLENILSVQRQQPHSIKHARGLNTDTDVANLDDVNQIQPQKSHDNEETLAEADCDTVCHQDTDGEDENADDDLQDDDEDYYGEVFMVSGTALKQQNAPHTSDTFCADSRSLLTALKHTSPVDTENTPEDMTVMAGMMRNHSLLRKNILSLQEELSQEIELRERIGRERDAAQAALSDRVKETALETVQKDHLAAKVAVLTQEQAKLRKESAHREATIKSLLDNAKEKEQERKAAVDRFEQERTAWEEELAATKAVVEGVRKQESEQRQAEAEMWGIKLKTTEEKFCQLMQRRLDEQEARHAETLRAAEDQTASLKKQHAKKLKKVEEKLQTYMTKYDEKVWEYAELLRVVEEQKMEMLRLVAERGRDADEVEVERTNEKLNDALAAVREAKRQRADSFALGGLEAVASMGGLGSPQITVNSVAAIRRSLMQQQQQQRCPGSSPPSPASLPGHTPPSSPDEDVQYAQSSHHHHHAQPRPCKPPKGYSVGKSVVHIPQTQQEDALLTSNSSSTVMPNGSEHCTNHAHTHTANPDAATDDTSDTGRGEEEESRSSVGDDQQHKSRRPARHLGGGNIVTGTRASGYTSHTSDQVYYRQLQQQPHLQPKQQHQSNNNSSSSSPSFLSGSYTGGWEGPAGGSLLSTSSLIVATQDHHHADDDDMYNFGGETSGSSSSSGTPLVHATTTISSRNGGDVVHPFIVSSAMNNNTTVNNNTGTATTTSAAIHNNTHNSHNTNNSASTHQRHHQPRPPNTFGSVARCSVSSTAGPTAGGGGGSNLYDF